LQLCCSHKQSDRPTLETISLNLQQIYDSLAASTSCDPDDGKELLNAIADHAYTAESIDQHFDVSHAQQQLPSIHQAILRSDVLAVQNMAAIRYSPLSGYVKTALLSPSLLLSNRRACLNISSSIIWAGVQLTNVKPYALACWLQVPAEYLSLCVCRACITIFQDPVMTTAICSLFNGGKMPSWQLQVIH
jgi:hypothetical protein